MYEDLFAERQVSNSEIHRPTIMITQSITPQIQKILDINNLEENTEVNPYGANKVVSRVVGCCSKHRITEVTRVFTELSAIKRILLSSPNKVHLRQAQQVINVMITEDTTPEFMKSLSAIFEESYTFNTFTTNLGYKSSSNFSRIGNLYSIEESDLTSRERSVQPQDIVYAYQETHKDEFYRVTRAIFEQAVEKEYEVHPAMQTMPKHMSLTGYVTVLNERDLFCETALKMIKAVNIVYRTAAYENFTKDVAKSLTLRLLLSQLLSATLVPGDINPATIECNLRASRKMDLSVEGEPSMQSYRALLDTNSVTVEDHVELINNPYAICNYLYAARLASRYYDDTKESLERHHLCALLLTIQRPGTQVMSLIQKDADALCLNYLKEQAVPLVN